MVKRADRDRFLTLRGTTYHYKRRVPANLVELDQRAPHIRISLKTDDLAVARALRDAYEEADDDLWASMLGGDDDIDQARKRYAKAVQRAEAMGFSYRPAREIQQRASWRELSERMEAVLDAKTPPTVTAAVLGKHEQPAVSLTKALSIYLEEIAADELAGKSEQQKRKWRVVPTRAVNTFVEVVGDLPISEISREDAHRFRRHWQDRVAPGAGKKATHTASSGNRQIGTLSKLYASYFSHMGDPDRSNPFSGLSFKERKKRTRPPFSSSWIKDVLFQPGALAGLNSEARAILLVAIDTGARPSEICNLDQNAIHLEGPLPHITIAPREDLDDPRELKTGSSNRDVPLIGVALEALKKHPAGFPRYREKEEAASAAINKYLRANKLTPTPDHTLYSLRHTFEDRMKEAGIGDEMRRKFFGHRLDREEYGSGGSAVWRREQLLRLELPFDPSIV